jgi:hypothetical protein
MCRTVWPKALCFSGSAKSTDGEGGRGSDVASCNKCTNESAGRVRSVRVVKSWSGSLPVEEKSETVSGWTREENMLKVWVP